MIGLFAAHSYFHLDLIVDASCWWNFSLIGLPAL